MSNNLVPRTPGNVPPTTKLKQIQQNPIEAMICGESSPAGRKTAWTRLSATFNYYNQRSELGLAQQTHMVNQTSPVPHGRGLKALLRWAATQPILGNCLDPFARSFHYVWKCQHPGEDTGLGKPPERLVVLNLIESIRVGRELLLTEREAYCLYSAVARTAKVKGAVAEVGVFQGASAKLICEAKGGRHCYLFDTFEGLPDPAGVDNTAQIRFSKGQFVVDVESVKNYLINYEGVSIIKGMFPATAQFITGANEFSFVHLDVDLYQSTRDAIEYFYPRMSRGGIIISHDYPFASGVRKAFDEFFHDKSEPVIELSENQCLIVKT